MNAFLLLFVIIVLLLVAELLAIAQLVQIAKMKGHYTDGAGLLWFIGIFSTVIMVAIIVALLPDRGDRAPQPSEANALPEV